MIDLHAHILPETDDGAHSLNESLNMLRMAQESGVRVVVATPHCNIPGSYTNYVTQELETKFRQLREAVKNAGIDVKVARGMEIFATDKMPQLLSEGKVWTLNNTRYFLTEFAFDENPDFCHLVLEECYERGFIPVIAHPERYFFVQRNPEIVYQWYSQGFGIQINKGSLLGRFGNHAREMARVLLQHGLVSCVASDAHTSYMRTTHMTETSTYLDTYFGTRYRKLVTWENPGRILQGKPMEGLKPIPFK